MEGYAARLALVVDLVAPAAVERLPQERYCLIDDVRVPGRCLLGGKEKLDAKLARAREAGHSGERQPAMST